jgi:hypothetical protein
MPSQFHEKQTDLAKLLQKYNSLLTQYLFSHILKPMKSYDDQHPAVYAEKYLYRGKYKLGNACSGQT